MSHEELLDLASVYALGALDGDDLALFRAHLGSCAECQAIVRDCERASTGIGMSLAPVAPSAGHKEKLMARISSRPAAPRPAWGFAHLAAAAAIIVAIVLGVLYSRAREAATDKEQTIATLHKQVEDQEQKVQQLRKDVDLKNADIKKKEDALGTTANELLKSKDELQQLQAKMTTADKDLVRLRKMDELIRDITAQVYALQGQGEAKEASARVILKDKDLYVFGNKLPPLAEKKVYELWALVPGVADPVPAGIFNDKGELIQEYNKIPPGTKKLNGFAISLEDKAVDKPTKILFMPAQ